MTETDKTISSELGSERTLTLDDVRPSGARGCTDIPMCLVFVASLSLMGLMNSYAFREGEAQKFLHPIDHAGFSCGLGKFADFPYIYYPAKKMLKADAGPIATQAYYANPKNLFGVCTSSCPTGFAAPSKPRSGSCPTKDESSCTWYDSSPATLVLNSICLPQLVKGADAQVDKFGVICHSGGLAIEAVHDDADTALKALTDGAKADLVTIRSTLTSDPQRDAVDKATANLVEMLSSERADMATYANSTSQKLATTACKKVTNDMRMSKFLDVVTDMFSAYRLLLVCAGVGVALSAIYLIIVSVFTGVVVWGSALLSVLGFGAAGALLWSGATDLTEIGLGDDGEQEKYFAIICWAVAGVLLLILVVCRHALGLAISISKITARFLLSHASIIMLPLVIAAIEIVWLIYWAYSFMGILSLAEVLPAEDVTQQFDRFRPSYYVKLALVFQVFMGFWVVAFFEGLSTVAVAVTVSDWYFAPSEDGRKPSRICGCLSGLWTTLRYHLGSVALGSLVLATIQTIRTIFIYLEHMASLDEDNCVLRVIRSIVYCCLCCVERCIRFINYNAYLMVGVSGKNFCSSALSSFHIALSNPRRFLVFHGVMWTVEAVGRLTILGGTLLIAGLMLNRTIFPDLAGDLSTPWPPLIAVAVFGYFLSGLVATVYSTAGAAFFYCFICEEHTCGGKSPNAPDELKALVDENEPINEKKNAR